MSTADQQRNAKLIRDHLTFIERQCERVLRSMTANRAAGPGNADIENDALELFNRVLDVLQKDNCKIVAAFSGRSKFTTYLSAIISRQAVDMIRRRRGRDRRRERARKGDDLDRHIYRWVVEEERRLEECYSAWIAAHDRDEPGWNEFVQRADTLLKRPNRLPGEPGGAESSGVFPGSLSSSSGNIMVPDPTEDPADRYQREHDRRRVKQRLAAIIRELPGSDRLILRMRFAPVQDRPPATVNEIARVMGLSPKSVYRRLNRALAHCKKRLIEEGFEIHD